MRRQEEPAVLMLTPQPGTVPGSYPFTVTATSTDDPSVTNTTNGSSQITKQPTSVIVPLKPTSSLAS